MAKNRAKKRPSWEKRRIRNGYIFILPWLFGFIFFFFRPLMSAVQYSLNEINFKQPIEFDFVGLEFFQKAFVDDIYFLPTLSNSLTSLLYEAPLIIAFSLTVAYVLSHRFFGATAFKSIFFLPVIVASGIAFTLMQSDSYASQLGSSVTTAAMFGAKGIGDLLSQAGLDVSVVSFIQSVVDRIFNLTWKSGIQILVFLSAFKSIPQSYYEASQLEGATGWESFCKITFPMISPMLITNIVYTIIDTFTDFANPMIVYINGVLSSQSGRMDISYGSALSIIYFMVIFAIIIVVYAIINRRVSYYNE
ncbi:MAG: sugar ABC transporter permease [Oscillospiraceae bacterium]|nr:sugar ABC transporter permease [Oscillospiraceae bacterium]